MRARADSVCWRRTARTPQQGRTANAHDHSQGGRFIYRATVQDHVFQNLDEDPAKPEYNERTKQGSRCTPRMHSTRTFDLLRDEDPFDARAGAACFSSLQQQLVAVRGPLRRRARSAERRQSPTCVRCLAKDLQDDGEANLGRPFSCFRGGYSRLLPPGTGQSELPSQAFAVRFVVCGPLSQLTSCDHWDGAAGARTLRRSAPCPRWHARRVVGSEKTVSPAASKAASHSADPSMSDVQGGPDSGPSPQPAVDAARVRSRGFRRPA